MTKIFILFGSRGEYDSYVEEAYGAFETFDAALAALDEVSPKSEAGWAAYQAFKARIDRIATERGFPDVGRDMLGQPLWTAEEHAQWRAHLEAERVVSKELGGEPSFFCKSDEYWISEFQVGALSPSGVEVARFGVIDGQIKPKAA